MESTKKCWLLLGLTSLPACCKCFASYVRLSFEISQLLLFYATLEQVLWWTFFVHPVSEYTCSSVRYLFFPILSTLYIVPIYVSLPSTFGLLFIPGSHICWQIFLTCSFFLPMCNCFHLFTSETLNCQSDCITVVLTSYYNRTILN